MGSCAPWKEDLKMKTNCQLKFYTGYVDDTLAMVRDIPTATKFLTILNNYHPALSFTMELANGNKLSFLGMMICKYGSHLTTMVKRKPTNTGLLLHFQSHVDQSYKRSLNRALRLSSSWDLFKKECEHLKEMFHNLKVN